MKKFFLPLLLVALLPLTYSCGSSRLANYILNEGDAASAIRQLLQLGARNTLTNEFNKDAILTTIFPGNISRTLITLNALGLSGEIDRFTTTMGTAAEKTATAAIPIFESSITNMKFNDAMSIIKRGGTSATDYLRTNTGSELRTALKPIVQSTLDEYKLNEQFNKILKPGGEALFGKKINLDLTNIMTVLVTEAMYKKIAEKEQQVRADAAARTTPLLQKVFSKNWN
jgi:hypothetical protein